jgi:hypothetical protein
MDFSRGGAVFCISLFFWHNNVVLGRHFHHILKIDGGMSEFLYEFVFNTPSYCKEKEPED